MLHGAESRYLLRWVEFCIFQMQHFCQKINIINNLKILDTSGGMAVKRKPNNEQENLLLHSVRMDAKFCD